MRNASIKRQVNLKNLHLREFVLSNAKMSRKFSTVLLAVTAIAGVFQTFAGAAPIEDVLGDLTTPTVEVLNKGDIPLANCKEILDSGHNITGLYMISPQGLVGAFPVFCDMTLRGGGWTVIHRRINGDVDFRKNWKDYRNGFGHFNGNFWLGLEKIKVITDHCGESYELHTGLQKYGGDIKWASYTDFSLDTELNDYKLTLDKNSYTGDAGDVLGRHSGHKFSTPDVDNDVLQNRHCASLMTADYKSGWWFDDCYAVNLNGIWYQYGIITSGTNDGIAWTGWLPAGSSLITTVMAVRPL